MKKLVLLSVLAACSAQAQERAVITGGAAGADARPSVQDMAITTMLKALGSQIVTLKEEVTTIVSRVDELVTKVTDDIEDFNKYKSCTAQDKMYAPTHVRADANGCVEMTSGASCSVGNDYSKYGLDWQSRNAKFAHSQVFMGTIRCRGDCFSGTALYQCRDGVINRVGTVEKSSRS